MIIELNDNITNGEVIQTLFPNIITERHEKYKHIRVIFPHDNGMGEYEVFTETWWNTPYTKGKEK